jgi:hypothetical protein
VGTGLVDPAVHLPTALRARSGEDHPTDEVRPLQCDLLGDESADGEAEQVDLGEPQRIDEGQRVAPELLERRRRGACRQAHPARVEQDDLALVRDVVDQGGVPVVEVAAEVLEEHDGHRAVLSVPAVGVRRAVGGVDGEVGCRVLGHEVPFEAVVWVERPCRSGEEPHLAAAARGKQAHASRVVAAAATGGRPA